MHIHMCAQNIPRNIQLESIFSSQLEIENKFCFNGLPGLPVWVHVAPGRTLALVSGKQQLLDVGVNP